MYFRAPSLLETCTTCTLTIDPGVAAGIVEVLATSMDMEGLCASAFLLKSRAVERTIEKRIVIKILSSASRRLGLYW